MRGFNYKKAVQSLSFLANENGGTLNKMKAIKLIWLADRLHLRQFGRSITGDEYYALQNGPVPSGTRDVLENSDFLDDTASDYASEYLSAIDKYNFTILTKPNLKVFSETDIKTLKTIFLKFGHLSHFALSDLSHLFPEWKKHESALNKRLSSRFPINQSDFFTNIYEASGLFNDPAESLMASRQIFEEMSIFLSVLR
jgi:uncharacterized phage-associated protein